MGAQRRGRWLGCEGQEDVAGQQGTYITWGPAEHTSLWERVTKEYSSKEQPVQKSRNVTYCKAFKELKSASEVDSRASRAEGPLGLHWSLKNYNEKCVLYSQARCTVERLKPGSVETWLELSFKRILLAVATSVCYPKILSDFSWVENNARSCVWAAIMHTTTINKTQKVSGQYYGVLHYRAYAYWL